MAALAHRLATNVPGDFFVDRRCIDCNTCNWLAPKSFDRRGEQSRVFHQPAGAAERRRAEMALIACPVAAIGTRDKHDLAAARAAFPERVADNVYHCGYHAEASYGAASYLIVRPSGNILIDSPRFAGPLVRRIEDLGGVATLFLSHRDDVADHARFAAHFGARRVMHRDDIGRDTRAVEWQIEGEAPIRLDDEVTLIPVPGHTRGSMCLLYRRTFLFSGDHVAWDPDDERIVAWREVCWYDWAELKRSMARLAEFRFEWILPGHGRRCHFSAPRMAAEMRRCLDALARE
jgi:glyoxylase-like metal-dependent hydrolase (beta-lactamase superfamily II)/ferredoxin